MGGRHRTDELEGSFPYAESPARPRGGRGKVLVPLAGAVALAVLLGVAAFVVWKRSESGAACGGETIALTVTASPDIEPAMRKAADEFNRSRQAVGTQCAEAKVVKTESFTVANSLSGTAGKVSTDVWVPDSSTWVTRAQAANQNPGALETPKTFVASSPIVIATPRSAAAELATAVGRPSWGMLATAANAASPTPLASKIQVFTPDPTRNAAGLAALIAGGGVLKKTKGNQAVAGVLKQLSQSTVPNADGLFANFGKGGSKAPIGFVTEQSVFNFNRTRPSDPAVALYAAEGTVNLDYPFIVTTKDGPKQQAADLLRKQLATPKYQEFFRQAGFRTPDGTAGAVMTAEMGVTADKPRIIANPDATAVATAMKAWSRLNLGARLLALLDISGTMAGKIPGSNLTRFQAVTAAAKQGMTLYPDKTEIGVWVYSDHLRGRGVDWKPLLPVGPLDQKLPGGTRRELINKTLATVKPIPTGNTGLFDTLSAAYKQMKSSYEPDKVNVILVFTDGEGNDDPGGGKTKAQLLAELKKGFDQRQPVNILLVSFGSTDKETMNEIAAATNGEAFFAENVEDINKIFLEGISRRLCAPNC